MSADQQNPNAEAGKVEQLRPALAPIIATIRAERCLPFLGAGASAGFRKNGQDVPGIPLGGSLGELIAGKCGYRNGATYDLPSVADYFVTCPDHSRAELEELIAKQIVQIDEPRPLHTALAQLEQITYAITSNYDGLLETAIQQAKRPPKRHVHRQSDPRAGLLRFDPFIKTPGIAILKMHGTVEEPRSMVITQSDYIRYLAYLNDPDRGMPEFFRKTLIPNRNLIFLGYSLADWNFRVIWEGVLANYRENGEQAPETMLEAFAILKLPTDPKRAGFLERFWAKRNITLIDCDLTDFARVLAAEFNLEIPQLGITKAEPGAEGGAAI